MHFQPALPDWKVRALEHCVTAVYNKIFVKFDYADNEKPFWDPTEWIIYVDSEPVKPAAGAKRPLELKAELKLDAATASATGTVNLTASPTSAQEKLESDRLSSPAVQFALKHGDPFTRGYYSVRLFY